MVGAKILAEISNLFTKVTYIPMDMPFGNINKIFLEDFSLLKHPGDWSFAGGM